MRRGVMSLTCHCNGYPGCREQHVGERVRVRKGIYARPSQALPEEGLEALCFGMEDRGHAGEVLAGDKKIVSPGRAPLRHADEAERVAVQSADGPGKGGHAARRFPSLSSSSRLCVMASAHGIEDGCCPLLPIQVPMASKTVRPLG